MDANLRKIRLSDSDFLYSLYVSRNPQDILTSITYKEQENFVQEFLESNVSHPYQNWMIIEKNDKPIGSVTLHKHNNELGFWIIPEFQGKGIGPKAVKRFMELCKKDHYCALVRSNNDSSIALVKKLGFKLTHYKFTY